MTERDQRLREWDGEFVVNHFDRESGAWIVVAVHSTRAGPAAGGTRMKSYADLAAAEQDALRLSEAMTFKMALAGLPRGGGKAVISVPGPVEGEERKALLRRYGSLIARLGGVFHTAPDVGTSPEDMDIIAVTGAPYVHARTQAAGGAGDSGVGTAVGVFAAIQVTCERLFGSLDLRGRTVLIQGVGSVGGRLARHLAGAGANVLVSDLDRQAAERLAAAIGAGLIEAEDAFRTPCDILSPCALGGILNEESISGLRCRALVGAANNQLADEEDAERIRERGILLAPDFVVNMGGVIAVGGEEMLRRTHEAAMAQVTEQVTRTLREVFDLSETEGIPTTGAARRLALSRLSAVDEGRD